MQACSAFQSWEPSTETQPVCACSQLSPRFARLGLNPGERQQAAGVAAAQPSTAPGQAGHAGVSLNLEEARWLFLRLWHSHPTAQKNNARAADK